MQNICTLIGLKILNKGRANRKWRRENVRSRRLSNHKWRRIPTLTLRRNVVAVEMWIQRQNTTSFPRHITTFKEPFIDVVGGCSDVDTTLSRRHDETMEQPRVSTSYQHFHCDCVTTSLRRRNSTLERRWYGLFVFAG